MHYGEETYTVSWNEGEAFDLSRIIPPDFPADNPSEVMDWGQNIQDSLEDR